MLAALLRSVGFEVTHHQAVVGGEGPTNHMVLLVLIDGETWIADAGLGEGFLDPLPLREGTYDDRAVHVTLEREPAGTWWMTHHEWGSFSGFRMAAEASPVIDFEPHHRRLATDPDSSFVQTLVVQKPLADRITTLRARTLSEIGPVRRHQARRRRPRRVRSRRWPELGRRRLVASGLSAACGSTRRSWRPSTSALPSARSKPVSNG